MTQNTCFICKSLITNTTKQKNVVKVSKVITSLNARPTTLATSTVIKGLGRFHVYVFFQNRIIFSKIDPYITLILAAANFVCKSAKDA